MSRVRFRMPGGMFETALPRQLANVGILHVKVDVRELLRLGILGPDALRSAEVGDSGFRRNTGTGQRDNARRFVDPLAHRFDGFIAHTRELNHARMSGSSRRGSIVCDFTYSR